MSPRTAFPRTDMPNPNTPADVAGQLNIEAWSRRTAVIVGERSNTRCRRRRQRAQRGMTVARSRQATTAKDCLSLNGCAA